jgi:phage gp29-like protein
MTTSNNLTSQSARNSKIGRQYQAAGKGLPKEDMVIINQLTTEFVDRSKKTIQNWRDALDAADHPEKPNWSALQDLYEYLSPDAHLGSQKEIRKGITEACRYYIRDSVTVKEMPDKTKLLEKEWFFNMMGDLLDHIFDAYTPLQFTDPLNGKYDLIPRRNFVPQLDMVLFEARGEKGVMTTDPAFANSFVVMKSQTKFGIMNDIVPDLIWKKTSRQCWSEFQQKFGIPLITATTNTRDKKELDRIEAMLKALGRAAQAIFPAGTTLDVKNEAGKGDPYNVFLKQMEYCDAQISKRILGGTMVSDNGSSKSQAEVHQDTLNYIIAERDKKKIEFCINNQVLPILRAAGMPFTETEEFVFDRSEDLTLKDHWDIIAKALELGYDIKDEWVSETFNFPISGRTKPAAPVASNAQARFSGFFS